MTIEAPALRARELLRELASREIDAWEEHGELCVRARHGGLDEDLRARIRATKGDLLERLRARKAIVTLKKGPGDPVFFFAALAGNLLPYRDLVRALPDGRAILGLEHASFSDASSTGQRRELSFADLAGLCREAIDEVFPEAPLTLCGWSMGGVLAHAVAALFEKRGRSIAQLVLVDAFAPVPLPDGVDVTELEAARRFLADALTLAGHDAAAIASLDTGIADAASLFRAAAERGAVPAEDMPSLADRFVDYRAAVKAIAHHAPPRVSGEAHLLRASNGASDRPLDNGWSAHVGALRRYDLPGDHHSLLRPPGVERLARSIVDIFNA